MNVMKDAHMEMPQMVYLFLTPRFTFSNNYIIGKLNYVKELFFQLPVESSVWTVCGATVVPPAGPFNCARFEFFALAFERSDAKQTKNC